MENSKTKPFVHFSPESIQESLRGCSSRTSLCDTGFLASSSDQDLASIGTSFETVASEVVCSTLRVNIVRGEPRTWFTSVDIACSVYRFLKPTQGNLAPSILYRIRFDAPRDPWEGFVEICFSRYF